MLTKRHVLIVTLAGCAAALAAPLSLAGGSTVGEPESSDTSVYVDPGPPIAPPTLSDSPGDAEQAEPPPQVTDTAESAAEDVVEEPEPAALTSEETVVTHPMCGGYLVKGDDIPPSAAGNEDVVDEPDPEPEVATAGDDASGDDLTETADELAADDDALDDGADADGLSGAESAGSDEAVITDEPAETTDDGAEPAGLDSP